ncbi:MAG: hypothetical protein HC879_22865 [Leptolyngbyaceae cyanobacterium SL_5_9]|nr:hypothetical protein [Leptolyngbyaceae cyanobacterium SL_5_9]
MQERILTKLWASRYTTDLSAFPADVAQNAIMQIVDASSSIGRRETVERLRRSLQVSCERAGIQTNTLFSYVPNVVNLSDAQRIAISATQLYKQTMEFYEQHSLPLSSFVLMPSIGLQAIEKLSVNLEPALHDLRVQHLTAKDPRTIGFLSTQFHFSTQFLLGQLTPVEQILLSPYFKFLEEQVCIPWKRICDAATEHSLESPCLELVRQMLPQSKDIAKAVFRGMVQLSPDHQSRRGGLNEPGVTASTIRDIQMFQGYLLLCILEGSVASIEEELVPLCVMVFPAIDVTWELVNQGTQLLIEELTARMQPEQIQILHPYARSMRYFFAELCG